MRAELSLDAVTIRAPSTRERVFLEAPVGLQPISRDEEHDRLAARRRRVQRALPALARSDAANRVEIEKDVVPADGSEPVAERDRLEIVPARMAEKNARHLRSTRADER